MRIQIENNFLINFFHSEYIVLGKVLSNYTNIQFVHSDKINKGK
jgi:hypothetical protein